MRVNPENDFEVPEFKGKVTLIAASMKDVKLNFEFTNDYNRPLRMMVYIVRFAKHRASKGSDLKKDLPTSADLEDSLKVIVRCIQRKSFASVCRALENGNTKHELLSLRPFIDPVDKLLMVGGRLKSAFILYDSRHQMLLPANHRFVEILVRHLHETNLHQGQKGFLAVVRQRFWPLRVKSTIKKVIAKCVTCFRANHTTIEQLMGDLPSYRVQPAPVFHQTGVDFAGPFLIKSSSTGRKPSIIKTYVCLFVCMITRVHDYSSTSS